MKAYIADRAALLHNLHVVQEKAAGTPVWAVLKGNGYGLGLEAMAGICREAGLVRLAVTEPADVCRLRQAGFSGEQILMLRPTAEPAELQVLLENDAVCTVGSAEDAQALSRMAAELHCTARVHIKVDTGMGRYGFLPADLTGMEEVYGVPGLQVTGIFTHFHSAFCSEAATRAQFRQFLDVTDALRQAGFDPGERHCANSSALFRFDDMRLDGVRVGSAILGRLSFPTELQRVGYCEATVEQLHRIPQGQSTGYGAGWTARRDTQAAIVSVGYYHGFGVERGNDLFRFRDGVRGILHWIRAVLQKKTIRVTVAGQSCPVIGHIGMLHTAIDVTDIACSPGDTVVLDINPLLLKDMQVVFR